MKITSLKNEHGVRVYHVIDDGCIHEFATYKTAQNFRLYCGEVTIKPVSPQSDTKPHNWTLHATYGTL